MLEEIRNGKFFALFLTGGIVYYYMEIIYRGYSHYSMIFCGGMCFYIIGKVYDINGHISMIIMMLIGGSIVTFFEFITGVAVNIILDMDVWDYSAMPFNFHGQICLYYSSIWVLITPVVVGANVLLRKRILK